MRRNNEDLKCVLKKIDFDNVKRFEYEYYCRKEIKSICEAGNEETIIKKFLYSYLGKVNFLCTFDEGQGKLFIKWYEEKGKENLIPLLEQVQYDKVKVISLVKTITRYELLLEQSIYEKNVDSILNLLIDMPTSICSKLKEWGCLTSNGRISYDPKFLESYESNMVNKFNLNNMIPAAMQVSLL